MTLCCEVLGHAPGGYRVRLELNEHIAAWHRPGHQVGTPESMGIAMWLVSQVAVPGGGGGGGDTPRGG
jgi:hypothetical protein